MKNILLPGLILLNLVLYGQTFDCGTTVSNELVVPSSNTSDQIEEVCSDSRGNLFYIKGNSIYKNHKLWKSNYEGNTRVFADLLQMTIDKNDNLYVFDYDYYQIFKIDTARKVSVLAGVRNKNGTKDTLSKFATFDYASDLVADSLNSIYVVTSRKIRKISADSVVSTYFESPYDSDANTYDINIYSATTDHQGNLLFVSGSNKIYRLNTEKHLEDIAASEATYYYVDDSLGNAAIGGIQIIHYGKDHNIYAGESNGRIRRISKDRIVTTLAGNYGNIYTTDAFTKTQPGYYAYFPQFYGIATLPSGQVLALCKGSSTDQILRKVTRDLNCEKEALRVSTFSGNGYSNALNLSKGRKSEYTGINGLAIDKNDVIYVAEGGTKSVLKLDPQSQLSAFYKQYRNTSNSARAVAVRKDGIVCAAIADWIEVSNPDGTHKKIIYSTIDEPFRATKMAFDANGDLIFTDGWYDNVRKMNIETETYETIAGGNNYGTMTTNEGFADGPALDARFYMPWGIDVDPQGNIYIGEIGNYRIRKMSIDGTVSTIVGGTHGSADGVGISAQLGTVSAVKYHPSGHLYIVDNEYFLIKQVRLSDANVKTIAGNVYSKLSSENKFVDGVASQSRFWYPDDIAIDSKENIYISDSGNDVIRKISGLQNGLVGINDVIFSTNAEVSDEVYPNPTASTLHLKTKQAYKLYDLQQRQLSEGNAQQIDLSNLESGIYMVQLQSSKVTLKVVKQ